MFETSAASSFTSPEGRGRIASEDAIRVRGYALSWKLRPLTRFALDDASHREEQIDLSPMGRGGPCPLARAE